MWFLCACHKRKIIMDLILECYVNIFGSEIIVNGIMIFNLNYWPYGTSSWFTIISFFSFKLLIYKSRHLESVSIYKIYSYKSPILFGYMIFCLIQHSHIKLLINFVQTIGKNTYNVSGEKIEMRILKLNYKMIEGIHWRRLV